ncbi:MAG: MotA/TolQ/ExbB proton channel family protein [Deltaproteobacteria bacterium]|nr:MotA/TolQ/ExbB proton channel family protein [Deltaproteobacteria bacterium]
MAFIDKYSIVLRWWLFFTVASLGTVALFLSGVIQKVNQADFTKISFLIYAVFAIFTVRTGIDTYRLSRKEKVTNQHIAVYYKKSDIGWFVSDMLLTLGMIGTVAGFIYMLDTSFSEMDPKSVISMQGVLAKMGAGMSTALYTTAAGLVCSLLLKLQVFNFTHHLDHLSTTLENNEAA